MTRRCRRRHGQGLCGLVAVLGLRYGSSGRDQPRSWRGVRSSPRSGTSGGTLRGGPGPEFWLNLTITPPRPPSGPPDQPAVAGQPCSSPFRQASPAPRQHVDVAARDDQELGRHQSRKQGLGMAGVGPKSTRSALAPTSTAFRSGDSWPDTRSYGWAADQFSGERRRGNVVAYEPDDRCRRAPMPSRAG